ncbi:MAG: response regulator, partial [Candidatus Dormibacteraceae bacterium]
MGEVAGRPEPGATFATPGRILLVGPTAGRHGGVLDVLSRRWDVEIAIDGAEALQVLQADAARLTVPDLVLIEPVMPGAKALELVRELRTTPDAEGVRVLLLAGEGGGATAEQALEAGAEELLPEPFSERELQLQVRLALADRRAIGESDRALQLAVQAVRAISGLSWSELSESEFGAELAAVLARYTPARRVLVLPLGRDGRLLPLPGTLAPEELELTGTSILGDPEGGDVPGRILLFDETWRWSRSSEPSDAAQSAHWQRLLDAVVAVDALAVGIRAGDDPLGIVLACDSTRTAGFTEEDGWLLRIEAKVALVTVRARDERQRADAHAHALKAQLTEMDQVQQLQRALASTLDVGRVAKVVEASVAELVFSGRRRHQALLMVASEGGVTMTWAPRQGDADEGAVVVPSDPLLQRARSASGPVSGALTPEPSSAWHAAAEARLTWGVVTPIRTGPRLLGMLAIAVQDETALSPDELRCVELVAGLAGLALANARHFEIVRREAERTSELENMKSHFLRLTSHELGGPLAILRGYMATLREGLVPLDTARVYEIMDRRLAEMAALVKRMLEAARLEDGRLVLVLTEVDLREAVQHAFEDARTLVSSGHHLQLALPAEPVTALADGSQVAVIVASLLDNAVKFSPDGGRIECRLSADSRYATVEVTDQGLGIA